MAENSDDNEIPLSPLGEQGGKGGRSAQYASGGLPGVEMAAPSTHTPFADLKNGDVSQEDFLMIQLSSFEGRAGH